MIEVRPVVSDHERDPGLAERGHDIRVARTGAQHLHAGDGVYVGEDIPPPILTEQMMQPKQRQPEQDNA